MSDLGRLFVIAAIINLLGNATDKFCKSYLQRRQDVFHFIKSN